MSHDVVVIGGGVNGLVAATYLGKAGRKVLRCVSDELCQWNDADRAEEEHDERGCPHVLSGKRDRCKCQ